MMWRDVTETFSREDLMAVARSRHPIGRIGVPTDVAHAAAFLGDLQRRDPEYTTKPRKHEVSERS
jgi:NAD(P)-dependent dehydrogenase (short-subunit alcohol dehydrogenase family)